MGHIGKYVEEANLFFKEVAAELEEPDDKDHAFRVTEAVLHALRGRITREESMHVISQLPLILKGMYVQGWKITDKPSNSNTLHEFLDEVRQHSLRSAGRDFGDDQQTLKNVSAVIRVLHKYVDEGEIADIKAQLPQSIAELFV